MRQGQLPRFPHELEMINGQPKHWRVITCSRCGATDRIGDAKNSGLPDVMISRTFRSKGWSLASRPGRDACPACTRGIDMTAPAEPQALSPSCRITAVPSTPKSPTPAPAPALKAEPPRAPSVSERRRVFEGLEFHYDVEHGRYYKSWSDEALAQKLDVPRAWVEMIRSDFFGMGVGNEAEIERDAEVARLETEVQAMLQRLSELEASVRLLRRKEAS